MVALSFGKDEQILKLIEEKCRLMEISFSRVTDRIILYGKEIESIISEFKDDRNLTDIIRRRATLEDVFLNLTGRQLRD